MRYEAPTAVELGSAMELVKSDGQGGKTGSGGDGQVANFFCNIVEVDD